MYMLWVVLTLGIPFAIGYAIGGTWQAGLEGLVWGGLAAGLPLPARDLQRELDLPHVRAPGLPLTRRVAEQLARRAARLRRGLAQQPPRVPGLGAARPAPVPDRRLVVGDPRDGAAAARLERQGARRRSSSSGRSFSPPPRSRPRDAHVARPACGLSGAARAVPRARGRAIPCSAPGMSV